MKKTTTEAAAAAVGRVLSDYISITWISSPSQEDRALMPTIPVPTQGISLQPDTETDLLLSMLVQHLEYLYLSKGTSAKNALSVRSSTVSLAHAASTHSSVPQFTRVLRHHYKNQLRMLAHRWKRLGLQHPSSANRNDQTSRQNQDKSQDGTKTKSFLKMSPIQSRQTAATKDNQEHHGTKANSCDPGNIRPVLSESYSDSDLSDQEKEIIETQNIPTSVELDLKPERFDNYLDKSYSPDVPEGYPDVLPSPLEALDFTRLLSSQLASEFQQSLDLIDPCLCPIIQRLVDLEKLQAGTVQKERERPSRPRPSAVQTQNTPNRVKKPGDIPRSRVNVPPGCKKSECNTATCAFTKLTLCPNSIKHQTCSSSKSGPGGRTPWPRSILPERPHTISSRSKREKLTTPKVKPQRVDATSEKQRQHFQAGRHTKN